jgi:hypothetical protein
MTLELEMLKKSPAYLGGAFCFLLLYLVMLTLLRRIWNSFWSDMNEPSAPYPADPDEWREAMERLAQEQAEFEQAEKLTKK